MFFYRKLVALLLSSADPGGVDIVRKQNRRAGNSNGENEILKNGLRESNNRSSRFSYVF